MANEQVDAFLKGESEPAPAETPPVEAEPIPQPAPEPAPQPENDDDEPLPVAAEGEPAVPRRALEDERHKRQNYAVQAAKFEAERDMLAKQLEEIKKAPPPPPAEPRAPIDPSKDPHAALLNERLNISEMLARDKLGDDKVDLAVREFETASKADPTLVQRAFAQRSPYHWIVQEMERQRVQREMGDDPVKWQEGERARIRAEIEAERAKAEEPKVSPVAGLPPSLATVRSASPRNAPAFTGDQSLDDILGQRRKK